MRKNIILVAMVALIVLAVSANWVFAKKDDPNADGKCTSYCARAVILVILSSTGDEVEWDADADGKFETCKKEVKGCHKLGAPTCPEFPANKPERCAENSSEAVHIGLDLDGDGISDPIYCSIIHGPEGH